MKIVRYPHPSLRHAAKPLTAIDKQVQLSIGAMLELMYEGKGLGLAGPQVVYPFQVFVMNLEPEQREKEAIFINPVIIERKSTVEGEEGCLSFPGLYQRVRRAKTVRYRAYNLTGDMIEGTTTSDLEARVWQHEVDHLHGELFIDKMGPLAKLSARATCISSSASTVKPRKKAKSPAMPTSRSCSKSCKAAARRRLLLPAR